MPVKDLSTGKTTLNPKFQGKSATDGILFLSMELFEYQRNKQVPLSVRMSNPGKYRAKINEEYMFQFQDTMYYIDLYSICTLQCFNKSIKCIYFFLKAWVHNLFKKAWYYPQDELCISELTLMLLHSPYLMDTS